MDYLLIFVTLGIIFGIMDAIWLKLSNKLYRKELGSLLLGVPNFVAAILFYAIYVMGVTVLVIMPAVQADQWQQALGAGALLGLVAYATYDLTNLATLKKWSVKIVVIDLMWGVIATGLSSLLTFFVVTCWFGL